MARTALLSFNRGLVSRLGLGRIDLKRLALSAERMTNWMPRVLGAMSIRVGTAYTGATASNAASRTLPFIFSTTDTARLEFTAAVMRVWIGDTLLTRPTVTTAVTNGNFTTNLASWTDNDEAGATSSHAAAGYMQLVGNGTARAIRDQQVTVSGANLNVEHALRVVIARGPVYIRVGSTSGNDDYVAETVLDTGTHSLAFTPSGDFHIRFFSSRIALVWVDSCNVESAGVVTLPTPWGASDLSNIRFDQSGDVVYIACAGYQQRKIERRGTSPSARSWSVVLYASPDGPFLIQNTSSTTFAPSALTGNITVTASQPVFKSTHVGALFSITSQGQVVTTTSAVTGTPTNSIRVTGMDNARVFSLIISGNASASTVDLQRSYDNSTWANVGGGATWTTDVTTTVDDQLDNQIVYYRLILTARVAPDTVTMELRIGAGSIRGVVRMTGFTSSTVMEAEVLTALGGTTANSVWQEGHWSDKRGWPTSVALDEGRLWWAGQNGIWGSVSDAFDSFDETIEGDAGPINRTIGSGPVDTINWLLPLKRLVLGGQGAEIALKSSSLEEPLTPTNFAAKATSTQGSGAVSPIKVDKNGYFINRGGTKLFELSFDIQAYDYKAMDMMAIVPELGLPSITRIAAQRQPDTRIHCVRSDGVALVGIIDRNEDVLCWVQWETDGFVEDVVVLPAESGDLDDQVYYTVRRVINGSTVRYHEKWAQETDCRGATDSRLADSHINYSGAASTTITGLTHLEAESVVVWGNGADLGTYTVSGGQITGLSSAVTTACVGLPYTAQFKSAKLGESMFQRRRNTGLGLLLADLHPQGLQFGPDFTNLDSLPLIEDGTTVGSSTLTVRDHEAIEFPATWTSDARVCLQAAAPRPVTVCALVVEQD
jgi:hypothetical protein